MDAVTAIVNDVLREAKTSHQRTGQWMVNNLPGGAYAAVSGTLFDIFHQELSGEHLAKWIENHLILDESDDLSVSIIGVFNKNDILWEAS